MQVWFGVPQFGMMQCQVMQVQPITLYWGQFQILVQFEQFETWSAL